MQKLFSYPNQSLQQLLDDQMIIEVKTLDVEVQATALVDIPVVSMPSIPSQHILEAYLCNNHTVSIYSMPHLSPHTDG